MMKMRSTIEPGVKLVRRHWLWIVSGLFLVFVLLVGSPAWAAPTASKLNQTVPEPTPTPDSQPLPTPTARPDGGDDEEEPTPTAEAPLGEEEEVVPASAFFSEPEEGQEDLTASVTVNNLNVRDGPGTEFAIVGAISQGTVVEVIARHQDGFWWYVCCVPSTTTEGWVSSELVEPSFDRTEADELIPVFGDAPPPDSEDAPPRLVAAAPAPVARPTVPAATSADAELPLVLNVSQSPPFVWQGQRVNLQFVIDNPNSVEIRNVEFSNELPGDLQYVDAVTGADGRINQQTTDSGATLILAAWPSIPAGGIVTVTISVNVSPDLPDAAVIDNLVAVRASNGMYTTGGISIGMPPTEFPDFQ